MKYRCARGSVRIVVFQRTEGSASRRFRNLADVLTMLSNHTSHPVEVVTGWFRDGLLLLTCKKENSLDFLF